MDYSTNALADLLGVHVDTVRRLAREGRLPGYKVGKLWRFSSEDVERMRRQTVERPGDELAYIDAATCFGTAAEAPADVAGEVGEGGRSVAEGEQR
jgi:excisionase family DNA binding protein